MSQVYHMEDIGDEVCRQAGIRIAHSSPAFLAKLIYSWFRFAVMKEDKKTNRFCKSGALKRFRLVFYLGNNA